MLKRITLFIVTNLLIMVTINIVLNILGVGKYITAAGIDYTNLMAFCLVWGMGGAFISLLISKIIAKWASGVKVINPNTATRSDQELLNMVHILAKRAGLKVMPEVGIYESPEVNAFATGPSKRNSLVAVSRGLLNSMNSVELEGVIAHEVSHISNGDMVTMTLIQGVVNAFTMFLSRVIAFAISSTIGGKNEDGEETISSGTVNMIATIVLDILFSILGSIVVAYFSRLREFKADAGAASISGKEKMIAALQNLQHHVMQLEEGKTALTTLKIASKPGSFFALFSTHPSLEDRINRLRNN